MAILKWLLGVILDWLLRRALDEGKAAVDRIKDEKTSEKNAAVLKEKLKKEGATDEEIEKAMLDLTNGRP